MIVVLFSKLFVLVAEAVKVGAAHGMTVTFLLTDVARLSESFAATARASVPDAVGLFVLKVPLTLAELLYAI